jgi:hypothetical protein
MGGFTGGAEEQEGPKIRRVDAARGYIPRRQANQPPVIAWKFTF